MLPKPIASRNPNFIKSNPIPGLNSVRHTVPYQGSMEPDDLLNLYTGNTKYRQYNKFLRADDYNTGLNQIVGEVGGRWDSATPAINRQQANQVIASVEPLTEAVLAQPAYQSTSLVEANNPAYQEALTAYKRANRTKGSAGELQVIDEFLSNASGKTVNQLRQLPNANIVNQYVNFDDYLDPQELIGSTQFHADLLRKRVADANNTLHPDQIGIPQVIKQESQNPPLQRGLHFWDKDEYSKFVNQHNVGDVVEYPAFTSTTSDPYTMQGFSENRENQFPVQIEFRPNPKTGNYSARDVNNPEESEYLYPPKSRFRTVDKQEMILESGMPQTKLILEETDDPTRVQARSQQILSSLSPSTNSTIPLPAISPEKAIAMRQAKELAQAHLALKAVPPERAVMYSSY